MKKSANKPEQIIEKPIEIERASGLRTVRLRKTPMSRLVDASLRLEHVRVSAMVALEHLKRRGQSCSDTVELARRTQELEDWVNGRIGSYLQSHPAYWWFSHVKGVGPENIAKVIGEIEAFGKFYPPGDIMIPPHVNRPLEKYYELEDDELVEKEGIWVEGIERCTTPSKLRVYAGRAPGMRRVAGQKIRYNQRLKMLLFRMASSLMRVKGYRWVADPVAAGYTGKIDDLALKKVNGQIVMYHIPDPSIDGKFYVFYNKYRDYLVRRETAKGTRIVPTPKERFCFKCSKEVIKKAAKFCPDCHEPLSLKKEPPGVLYEGHLHLMALDRMEQCFLDMLWVAWRKPLGLPLRQPYPVEYLGHSQILQPEDFMDK